MNWLTRAFQWNADTAAAAEPAKADWTLDGGRPGQSDRDNFTTNRVTVAEYDDGRMGGSVAAGGLAATWACVQLIAGTISTLPLMVYRPAKGGGREVARDHPLFLLFRLSPNADQTIVDWLDYMAASIELQGNAYSLKLRNGSGVVVGLEPLRPDRVRVSRRTDGRLIYRWSDRGVDRERSERDILHVRGPGGGALGGCSPLTLCRHSFASAVAVDRAASSMFRNGARPSGTLSMEKRFESPEKRAEMEGYVHEKFVGAVNAGRPMLLDGGLKWESISINPIDAQMLESRKFSGEEVCRIFGVPPVMAGYGDKSSNWGTGKQVDYGGFQKFTLRRRVKRFEAAMMMQLLTPEEIAEGYVIEFSLEGILRGASDERSNFYGKMTGMGAMTINEVRALENMPPVAGGDEPRMQIQNVPITAANNDEEKA